MKTLPLTEVGMFSPFVLLLEEHGVSMHPLLDRVNVSREMVDHGGGKVTKIQFYQFLEAGGRSGNLPDLGYRTGARQGMRFIGPVGQSVLRAATLNDAIDTFAVHLRRWLDGNLLWLEPARDSQHVWLCNLASDGLHSLQAISNQCAIMTLVSLVREVAGRGWTPDRIRVDPITATVSRAETSALADAAVEIIPQGVAIQLPKKFLSRSLPKSEPASGNREAGLPPASPEQFAASIERTLCDQLPFLGVPTIQQAAEVAGVSPRTLQRQLGMDGLTYQRLIDRVRFQVARRRLQDDPRLTTRELANELCFSTPSNFVRSFKRIAGVTPGAFARQQVLRTS